MSNDSNTTATPSLRQSELQFKPSRLSRRQPSSNAWRMRMLQVSNRETGIRAPGWVGTLPRLDDRDSCLLFVVHNGDQRLVATTLADAHAIVARTSPDATIQAMAAVLHEGLAAPDEPVELVHVIKAVAEPLKHRCKLSGISFGRLVSAVLLSHLVNMTPQKTGSGMIESLTRWKASKRRLRPWPVATIRKEVQHVA